MAEIEGIDMFIVFADVEMADGEISSQSELSALMNPFASSGQAIFRIPGTAAPLSTARPTTTRSARSGQDGATSRSRNSRSAQSVRPASERLRSAHDQAQARESESLSISSEFPSPPANSRTDIFRRDSREEGAGSGANARTAPAGGSSANATSTNSAAAASESQGGNFVSRFLSSMPLSRQQSWTHVHSTVPSDGTALPSSTTQATGRNMIPAGLEQILQRAFSQISGESMMSEFMRRVVENQRRGNPPASSFAMENLEAATTLSCQPCTICQDDICKGCEAVHMPCKHAFHRECLIPWLQEHNTCPICRCEIESHCARYNQSNFDKLKGALQPVTVSNHADPSRMAPTGATNVFGIPGLSGSSSQTSSHVRMTIRMPFPAPQGFDFGRTEVSRAPPRPEATSRPAARTRQPNTRQAPPTPGSRPPASPASLPRAGQTSVASSQTTTQAAEPSEAVAGNVRASKRRRAPSAAVSSGAAEVSNAGEAERMPRRKRASAVASNDEPRAAGSVDVPSTADGGAASDAPVAGRTRQAHSAQRSSNV